MRGLAAEYMKILIKRQLPAAFLISSVLLFTPGCSAPGQAKTIRFAYIAADQLHSPAVMVMKEKKYLEKAGYKVEWSEYLAGSHIMQDMANGAVDFACCGAAPVIVSESQGNGCSIIAGSNQEGSSLVVGGSVQTVKDLDGKKIATPGHGSIQEMMLAKTAKEAGVEITYAAMEVSNMPLFLQKGEIDGFIAWAPYPAKAVSQGIGRELLSSHSMMSGHQCCVLVVKDSVLDGDPQAAEDVLKAYLKAYEWFMDHRKDSIKLIAKATGTDEKTIGLAIETVTYAYPPYFDGESIRAMAEGLAEAGRINVKPGEMDSFVESLCCCELLESAAGAKRKG